MVSRKVGYGKNAAKAPPIWLILVVTFAASVFIRLPYLSRPLGWYHESGTAIVLIVQKIWDAEGGFYNRFVPKMTYSGQANKFVTAGGLDYQDKVGNFYYLSYPPLAYIGPYLLGKLFGIHPNVVFIKSFSVFLHFLTAVGLFRIVNFLIKKARPGFSSVGPAFLTFVITIFSAGHLWSQGNIYEEAIAMVLPLFVFGILLFLMIVYGKPTDTRLFLPFWLVSFLMIYAGWLGIFFAFGVVSYAFFHWRDKARKALIVIPVTACLAAVLLIVWQYSKPEGIYQFLLGALSKFKIRSWAQNHPGGPPAIFNYEGWRNILYYYWIDYGPFLLLILCLGLMAWGIRKKNRPVKKNPSDQTRHPGVFATASYVSLFPGALRQLVLFNSTNAHDFECLKTGLWLPIVAGWLLFRIMEDQEHWRGIRKVTVYTLIALATVASVASYLRIHQKPHDAFKFIGEYIRDQSNDDEVVFLRIKNFPSTMGLINAQVVYYANRNIGDWKSLENTKELMDLNGTRKFVLFEIEVGTNPVVLAVGRRASYSELVSAIETQKRRLLSSSVA